jgi:hypothetical protein
LEALGSIDGPKPEENSDASYAPQRIF